MLMFTVIPKSSALSGLCETQAAFPIPLDAQETACPLLQLSPPRPPLPQHLPPARIAAILLSPQGHPVFQCGGSISFAKGATQRKTHTKKMGKEAAPVIGKWSKAKSKAE